MKKLLIFIALYFISTANYAQFSYNYEPTDSSWTNYGGWSLKKLYSQKDSTSNTDSDYFKFYNKNVHFIHNEIKLSKSSISSNNFLLVDSISGKTISTKFLPFNRVSGFTSSSITSTLGYTPYNSSNPSNYINQLGARSSISLTTTGTSGPSTYNSSTGIINIPQYTGTTYTAGTGISIASNTITNIAPDQTVSLTSGRGITITGTYPNFTISLVTPTITIRNTANSNARTVNSNFTIDANKEADVTYTLTCSVTNPLLAGSSTANAYLEYSTNGGTTWQLPSQSGNSSTVGVAVAIAITNGQTGTLVATIPANALVRIRTATTGTASVTYVTGQETVY